MIRSRWLALILLSLVVLLDACALSPRQQATPGITPGDAFIWPLEGLRAQQVSSNFGARNQRHRGIDLAAKKGTLIRAAANGRVIFAGKQRGYGKVVIIDHGGGVETRYAHNSRNLVRQGQVVLRGASIAKVGRTGNASGNHVHFEYRKNGRPLNPADYIDLPR